MLIFGTKEGWGQFQELKSSREIHKAHPAKSVRVGRKGGKHCLDPKLGKIKWREPGVEGYETFLTRNIIEEGKKEDASIAGELIVSDIDAPIRI